MTMSTTPMKRSATPTPRCIGQNTRAKGKSPSLIKPCTRTSSPEWNWKTNFAAPSTEERFELNYQPIIDLNTERSKASRR